jgi:NAD(P)H dehydrogenase (quinone)
MDTVKLAIIYSSMSGTNYRIASEIQEAAEEFGATVRLRRVAEVTPRHVIERDTEWLAHIAATRHIPEASRDDLRWANAYIFGSPTRYGNVTASFKNFIDSTGALWDAGELSNKVAAGFTSAQNVHGGQETTLLSMYNILHHWGAILVPPGYTDERVFAAGGNPYGVSATANGEPVPETVLMAARHLAERVVMVAQWMLVGRAQLDVVNLR